MQAALPPPPPARRPAYLQAALAELEAEDSLLVLAKGLGVHAVLRRLVESQLGPENLVLVLNTSRDDEALTPRPAPDMIAVTARGMH